MSGPVIGARERRGLLFGSFLIVLLSLLPNLVGYLLQTPEMRFNGAAINWPDVATHLIAIRSGMEGNWRFTLFFTPLPQHGHYVKLFYIALGNLFRATRATPITIYYVSLAVLNMGACLALYRFIAEFIDRPKYRATAFLLAIFGSGLGWLMHSANLLPNAGYTPIDLWLIDAYPYISMVVFPHFSAIIIGQLGFILLYLRYREKPRVIYPIGMAFAGLLLQAIQPYAPLIPFLIVGGLVLGDWITQKSFPFKPVLVVTLVGIVQLPLLVYNISVFANDPLWYAFASQNLNLSPPPVYYLWGFFCLWLLSLPAFFKPQPFIETKRISLFIWVAGALVLAYLPWQMQRRFMLYYTVPLAIIGTLVIQEYISPFLNRQSSFLARRKPILLFGLVILAGFSNLYLILALITADLPQYDPSRYHPSEISQALAWLEDNTEESDLMVSAPETGLLAGVQIARKVFVAHEFETAEYDKRVAQIENLYQNQINISELGSPRPEWIFYGPYEREIGPDFEPPPDFTIAYQKSGVRIYRLMENPDE